jgi:hypothetical protein
VVTAKWTSTGKKIHDVKKLSLFQEGVFSFSFELEEENEIRIFRFK